ncbi:hypothetical protein NONO_c10880 [Nocardia nova SH22a]|uniref:Uncharacterized protein n=1 Tax=Nocardia nova SH22a TaxID=1415166 RepID=W5T9A4_9NOCA|nr:type VII secretion target [Nocardia nova]AHH15895.1 hypothetical protein NONO_c10880 [Nocardia nova SH22a]
MADYLNLEPDELRAIALQYDAYIDAVRKWGEIPKDWLREFPDSYGSIAGPLHDALHDYYQRRHEKAEAQAEAAARTRDSLRAAADGFDKTDDTGKHQLGKAFPGAGPDRTPSGPGEPPAVRPNTPEPHEYSLRHIPDAVSEPGQDGGPAVSATPPTAGPIDPPRSMPYAEHPVDDTAPAHTAPQFVSPTAGDSAGEHSAAAEPSEPGDPSGSADSSAPVGSFAPVHAPTGQAMPPMAPTASGPTVPAPDRPPRPLRTGPFAVSAHPTPGQREGLPLVVGDGMDDDLALARALLSAVLSAVDDTARGVEWATGVARTDRGTVVLLTSTEGRGWIPAGLFLPSEVLVLWRWDSLLDADGRAAMTRFENNADPARIITEFGRHVSRTRRGRLRALASSIRVDDFVRAALGDEVAIADGVVAGESAVDLSEPGTGLADRLDMAGSPISKQRADLVPDADIHAVCLQLASAADELVRRVVPGDDPATGAQRARRRRALDSLRTEHTMVTGTATPATSSTAVFAPSTGSRAPGGLAIRSGAVAPPSSDVDIERGRALERRADELISLLLAGNGDRRMLRDILYVHDQIAEHPQLQDMLEAAPTRTADIGSVDVSSSRGDAVPDPVGEYSSLAVSPGLNDEQRSVR